jgi:hypothetical protein
MHNMAFLKSATTCRGLQKSRNNTHAFPPRSGVLICLFHIRIVCPTHQFTNGIVLKHKITIVSIHYKFRFLGHDESIMWSRIGTCWSGLRDMVVIVASPSTILSLYLYDQPTNQPVACQHDAWSLEVASLADVHSLARPACSRVNILTLTILWFS